MSRTHLLLRNIFADLKNAETPDDIMRQIKLLEVKFPKLHGTDYLRLRNLIDKGIKASPNRSIAEKYFNVKVGDLSDISDQTTIKALTDKGLNETSINHFYNEDQILDSVEDVQTIGKLIVAGIQANPVITDKEQLIKFLCRLRNQTHGLLNLDAVKGVKKSYDKFVNQTKDQKSFTDVIKKVNGSSENEKEYDNIVDDLEISSTFADTQDVYEIARDADDEGEFTEIMCHYVGNRGTTHMFKYDADLEKFVFADSKDNDRKLINALVDNLNYDPDDDEDCDEDDEDQCCDHDDCDNEDCDDECDY